jgi:hypothetical protein
MPTRVRSSVVLPAPVGAQQGGDLAVARREADASQRLHGAELFADFLCFDHE